MIIRWTDPGMHPQTDTVKDREVQRALAKMANERNYTRADLRVRSTGPVFLTLFRALGSSEWTTTLPPEEVR